MSIVKILSRSLKSGKETQPNLLIDEMTKCFVQHCLLTSYILYWIWLTVLLMALGCSSIGQEQQPVFWHQVAAGVKDMFYNFYAVKLDRNAGYVTTTKAKEKITCFKLLWFLFLLCYTKFYNNYFSTNATTSIDWARFFITFYICNLWMFVISFSAWHWQAFSAW